MPQESPYEKDLYVTRTVFLVETGPQTDEFYEVLVTHETANKLRDVLQNIYGSKNGDLSLPVGGRPVKFSEARGEVTQQEIDKALQDDQARG